METVSDEGTLEAIASRYQALSELLPLRALRSEADYDRAVAVLDNLLDAGAADEQHPLADLVNVLGQFISAYDEQYYPLEDVPASATLRLLMEQHNLGDAELPEIGAPFIVAEVLSGARVLTVSQINALAQRFNVPGSVFLAE